ncbi:glycosyltransferase [Lachnospiraceae bacterium 47-T17]
MERTITYSVSEKNTVEIEANIFCTYLYNSGIDKEKIRMHFDVIRTKELNSFWKVFGYKYAGILVHKAALMGGIGNSDDLLRMFPETENDTNYIIREVLALYYDVWDKKHYTTEQISTRVQIANEVISGVHVFESRAYEENFLNIYYQAAENYLKNGMTRRERILIQELPCIRSAKGKYLVYPLTVTGQYTIGVVNPWPGDPSAEAEVLHRMSVAADDACLGYIMLDNFSHVLDADTQEMTENFVDSEKLEFVITTHYDSEKTADAFYYHTLWNPPEIPLNLPDYDTRVTRNYLMNDDYLIYDFGGMSNHLRGILLNRPRTIEGASRLTASFPESKILKPRLDDPKLFYCGMNWEKVVSNSNRHEGLFKLLDQTGKVKFFGPDKVKAWGGLRPWEGYKCYQYSIPFDGFSILKEINECGICLVLSSDIHRRAGAATNRTYEACAAGAVIISDDNEFMQHYFSDAALFIEYNKNNPKDTFDQIMEKYQWIIDHKEEALVLARRAQQIFKEYFALDKQFLQIANKHYERFHVIASDLFAKNENKRVLVSYVVNTLDLEEAREKCQKVIKNITNQYYGNIILGLVCDESIKKEITEYVQNLFYSFELVSMDLYDSKGCRQYTDGQAIGILREVISHDYWINIWTHEIWFYDHITTLVRVIQDTGTVCAYSGRQHKDKKGCSRVDFFDKIHISTVFGMNSPDWLPVPGQLLFKAECHSYVPQYMLECMDGYEHYAYLGMIWVKAGKEIAFSRRMTSCWCASDMDERCNLLKAEYQIRYIRDVLKFDIPDGGLGGNGAGDRNILRQYIATFPVRAWFKMRWKKMICDRLVKWNLPGRKKTRKEFQKHLEKFMEW